MVVETEEQARQLDRGLDSQEQPPGVLVRTLSLPTEAVDGNLGEQTEVPADAASSAERKQPVG